MNIPQSTIRNPNYENLVSFARKALGIQETAAIELFPFPGRGSDRSFFRVKGDQNHSTILIHYDPKRAENRYYADIAVFLREHDVPVPRLIGHDPDACLVLMEDLGDEDLWSLRKESWEIRRDFYRKLLAAIHRLHSFPEKDFPSDRVRLMEGFNPDLYRWERDYFKNHFVKGVCRISLEPSFEKELEAELSGLAERLLKTKRSLVHRDLQSQNVMIRNQEVFLVDFQGMRFGTPFYDLGSLLCDPYVEFSESERFELLSFYYGLAERDMSWVDFQNFFWEASAQRLMQALGAYGFLGLQKGLKTFLDYIPAGLRNLLHAASHSPSLPLLWDLCSECQSIIG